MRTSLSGAVERRPTGDGEICLNVSALGRSELRATVRALAGELGYSVREEPRFWSRFFRRDRPLRTGASTLVVGDLSRIARRFQSSTPQDWTAAVRRHRPYFLAFVRTRQDERCAWLVDDLVRHSDLRISVCPAGESKREIRRCVAEALSAAEPDSLVDVRVPPEGDRLRVEFADGLSDSVGWEQLGIDALQRERLVVSSATVGRGGKTVELRMDDGSLFEIDAAAVRALLDPAFAAGITELERRADATVGERMRAARRAAGLTQQALAERLGVDQAVISRLETGRHRPRVDTVARIAEGLGVSVSELLAG